MSNSGCFENTFLRPTPLIWAHLSASATSYSSEKPFVQTPDEQVSTPRRRGSAPESRADQKKWPRLSQMCHHFRLTKHVSWPWHSLSCLSSMVDPVLICLVILDIVVNMKQPVANKQLWLDQMLSSMVDYLLDSYLYFIFVLEHSCQIQIVQIKTI